MSSVHLQIVHGEGGGNRPRDVRRDAPALSPQRLRIIDAALGVLARQGLNRCTVDDVAREAGCSRATVYRVFPGGKDEVLQAVADTEVSRFFSRLAVSLGTATCVEEVIVTAVVEAARAIRGHEALNRLLDDEPERILPHLAFAEMDSLLRQAAAFTAPFLGRFMGHAEAERIAEWTCRMVLSYLLCPAEGVDLTDEDSARRLVAAFVLPAVRSLRRPRTPQRMP